MNDDTPEAMTDEFEIETLVTAALAFAVRKIRERTSFSDTQAFSLLLSRLMLVMMKVGPSTFPAMNEAAVRLVMMTQAAPDADATAEFNALGVVYRDAGQAWLEEATSSIERIVSQQAEAQETRQ